MHEQVKGFDQIHSKSITASSTVNLFSVTVSSNLFLVITHFANMVNDVAALGNLTWQVKVNGSPRPPLDSVLDQYGDISQPYVLAERIYVPASSIISVDVVNSDTSAYDAGVLLKGQYFSN